MINLTGAAANTSFDVYIDQESAGNATSHKAAGTFTTNGSGNATFTNTIDVAGTCPSVVDNEIVLQGASFTAHQYIQQSFNPCEICVT